MVFIQRVRRETVKESSVASSATPGETLER
jgi:hypothetical protein